MKIQKKRSIRTEIPGRLGSESKTTSGRKNYIVLLANKPDYFKDGEMTYLGFSDDYKERSMVEEDIINFSSGTASSKGILVFSGSKSGNANCTLTFPRKHLVKIVAKPLSDSTDATITFTNKTIVTYNYNNDNPELKIETDEVTRTETIVNTFCVPTFTGINVVTYNSTI